MSFIGDLVNKETNAAIDSAASRPFNVVLSVSNNTQVWVTGLLLLAFFAGILVKKRT